MMLENKKAQASTGLITALVFGIATLVIGVIIAFTITSTLTGAGLLTSTRTSATVVNDSGWINATTFTLAGVASNPNFLSGSFVISSVLNTSDGITITSGNYSLSDSGVVSNATATNWEDVKISYTYTIKSAEEVTTAGVNTNFTAGIDNVSSKIPTVLLVAAIILIIGVLGILVGVWQKMRIGGSSL